MLFVGIHYVKGSGSFRHMLDMLRRYTYIQIALFLALCRRSLLALPTWQAAILELIAVLEVL